MRLLGIEGQAWHVVDCGMTVAFGQGFWSSGMDEAAAVELLVAFWLVHSSPAGRSVFR